MLIDTHAHLNFRAFQNDADEVLRRCLDNGVWVINVGSQLETSQRAIELAKKYPQGVYATVGLYPLHIPGVADLIKGKLDLEEAAAQESVGEFKIDEYRNLILNSKKIVGIGEIGLDYYWRPKSKTKLDIFKNLQKQGLILQMDLANELNLPIIFHCRSAHNDLIEILNTRYKIQNTKLRGVIHCFTGNIEQAREYLDLGLYLGFNGIIFKNIQGINWQEIILKAPLDRILIETDSPYLTPPMAGVARNEPIFVKYVAQEIAKIKKLSYEEVTVQTTKNAQVLFNI